MEEVTAKKLKEVLSNTDKAVLVDFWAPWCNPCEKMNPIIEEIGEEYEDRLKTIKVNIDDSRELADKLGILKIPSFLIFKDGEEVDKMVGEVSKDDLTEKIDKYL
ncbi:MAG: thioredoxin [Candidatus Magasanikbacteria bacterium]